MNILQPNILQPNKCYSKLYENGLRVLIKTRYNAQLETKSQIEATLISIHHLNIKIELTTILNINNNLNANERYYECSLETFNHYKIIAVKTLIEVLL